MPPAASIVAFLRARHTVERLQPNSSFSVLPYPYVLVLLIAGQRCLKITGVIAAQVPGLLKFDRERRAHLRLVVLGMAELDNHIHYVVFLAGATLLLRFTRVSHK